MRRRLAPYSTIACAVLLAACGDSTGGRGDGGLDGSLREGGVRRDGQAGGTGGSGGDRDGATDVDGAADGGCVGDECASFCKDDEIWTGKKCARCPPCDGEGEISPWPEASRNGFCICETAPGFFYSVAGRVGAQRCDADGDGWVRLSARTVLEENNDPALMANAHCDLREVGSFTLRNEKGDQHVVKLAAPVPLYESDRNDDDELLKFRWDKDNLPNYHKDDKPVSAAEINALTKLCHAAKTDYNDNGIADVAEYAGMPLPAGLDSLFTPFVDFSYFAELHRGYYKASTTGGDATYVIQEKSRLQTGAANTRVQLKYDPSQDDGWRTCTLVRDPTWDDIVPPVGMDFAKYNPGAAWAGMNFHSQFQCFLVSSTRDADNPKQVLRSDLEPVPLAYDLSRCRAQGLPVIGDENPADTSINCAIVSAASTALGEAYWGAARYVDYHIPGDPPDPSLAPSYVRGCVNACALANNGCAPVPGPTGGLIRGCIYDPDNFGKKTGCAEECDGLDNDFDGNIDDGASGQKCAPLVSDGMGGFMPDPALPGDCALGVTVCDDVAIPGSPTPTEYRCATPLPGDRPEVCDGFDNDCDDVGDDTDADISGFHAFCNMAVDPDDGTPLDGLCTNGQRECREVTFTPEPSHDMLCISTVAAAASENPCDLADDDCDGKTDETWSYWEGDDPSTGRVQCGGTVNEDCSSDGAATSVSGHQEICRNKVDDDCDGLQGTLDEYAMVGMTVTALSCKWRCTTEGATRCSHVSVPDRLLPDVTITGAYALRPDVTLDLDAVDPTVPWFFYPPWWNGFWKVLVCTSGYWEILEVCGLGNAAGLPGDWNTPVSWGGNLANPYCTESTSPASCTSSAPGGTPYCSYDATGTIPGCVHCKGAAAPCIPPPPM